MASCDVQKHSTSTHTHADNDASSRPSLTSQETSLEYDLAGANRVLQPDSPNTPVSDLGSPLDPERTGHSHAYLRALYHFEPSMVQVDGDEDALDTAIALKAGDLILVHSVDPNGWADGTVLNSGDRGWLPTNFCKEYSHPYLCTLLNAVVEFWDVLGASESATLSDFVRQDYVHGLIQGVRGLLEQTDCLHRNAALVERHVGVRRIRKGLLADLSSLVQVAKGLRETISEPFAGEVVHYLLEDMIKMVCKVITRAINFVDIWSKECGISEFGNNDWQPQFDKAQSRKSCVDEPDVNGRRLTTLLQQTTQAKEIGSVDSAHSPHTDMGRQEEQAVASVRPSRPSSFVQNTRTNAATHRRSRAEITTAKDRALASQQLARHHDFCIGHIAAFIGHHIQSRPSRELKATTARLEKSCHNLLSTTHIVISRAGDHSSAVKAASEEFERNLDELLEATRSVFNLGAIEDDHTVILSEQSQHLISLGTCLIRAASNCVGRTRSLIDLVGDFEVDMTTQRSASSSASRAEQGHLTPGQANAVDEDNVTMTSFERRLSRKMGLPATIRASIIRTERLSTILDPSKIASDAGDSISPKTLRPVDSVQALQDGRSHSTECGLQVTVSEGPFEGARISTLAGASEVRQASMGISVAGSTDTAASSARHSGSSQVSGISTRATTPDLAAVSNSPDTGLLNSFTTTLSELSAPDEASADPKTRAVLQTYADELVVNKDGQVIGGSLPALVEKLTVHDSAPDVQFMAAFYLTFRMFCTARDLAQALMARFDGVGDSNFHSLPVRLRVYNVFKGWLETYWTAAADRDALGDIRYFAMHKLKEHVPSAGARLLDLTRKVASMYSTGASNGPLVSGVGKSSLSVATQTGNSESAPEPAINKAQLNALRTAASGGAPCSILDFEPIELARQITLLTSEVYCRIQSEELLSLGWSNRETGQAENIRVVSAINTDLAHVVGDTLLAPEDAKKRALLVKHWIKVAAHCLELNNYDSLMAITCSLNSSVVQRLKRTWQLVSKKTIAKLEELNAVVDCSRNHASLRKRLEEPLAPCIPFLGIYLTDLTFLDAGNPRMRELPGRVGEDGQPILVINFDKYMRMAKVVGHLQRFQMPYKLRPVPEMRAWMEQHLHRMRTNNDTMVSTFHRRSLLVEPRQEIARPKSADGRRADVVETERPKTSHNHRTDTFWKTGGLTFKKPEKHEVPMPDLKTREETV